jgi:nucleotide-binding universal stress UspA family protein
MVWIAAGTWERCVEQARALVPGDAEVTLVHVAPGDVEAIAGGSVAGLLGRRPPSPPEPAVHAISDEQAHSLLAAAAQQLGRPAKTVALRGRVEREVVKASGDFDLLVLARDGTPGAGPKSVGKHGRFVVDHAGCPVLLLPREGTQAPVLPLPPPNERRRR